MSPSSTGSYNRNVELLLPFQGVGPFLPIPTYNSVKGTSNWNRTVDLAKVRPTSYRSCNSLGHFGLGSLRSCQIEDEIFCAHDKEKTEKEERSKKCIFCTGMFGIAMFGSDFQTFRQEKCSPMLE